ncbi:MAG: TrkH family potassium uptake protein [Ndongobacter sp.]|nr:TrkH family potassium uptake protein [Ndongobacter sp.]
MNYRMISTMVGKLLRTEAYLMVCPLIVAFLYRESSDTIACWLFSIAVLLACSCLLTFFRPTNNRFYTREGMVICASLWILMSFFGGLPLFLTRQFPSLIDSFFEIASGFTTTGASVCNNVEALSHSILFWRSFTHLIGGMGVLVFALALSPKTSADSVHMMRAEVPGPTFGKLVAKLGRTARLLYAIYLAMTAIVVVLLLLGGMPLFDSLCHAFGAAGTGGFGIKNNSIAYYSSSYIHNVLSVSMIAFGINFNLYYLLLLKNFRDFFHDEELRWYLGIIFVAVLLICLNVWPLYTNPLLLVRDVFFSVSSIITTTGYATANFDSWPLFSHIVLLLAMFIGSCAGSTGGGLKVSRVAVYIKAAKAELKKQREPNRIAPVRFNRRTISEGSLRSLKSYLSCYLLIFIFMLFIVSLDSPNFQTAFSAVAATLNNIGPGLDVVGPTGNYAGFSALSKLTLSMGMITGRLEIWPVVILCSPKTWRRL